MTDRIDEIESRLRDMTPPPPSPQDGDGQAAEPAPRPPETEVDGKPEAVPELHQEPAPAPQHAAGDLHVPDGYTVLTGGVDGRRAVAVVVSKFNGEITSRMLESALGELDEVGVPREAVLVMPVPGAFELPLAAMALAKTRRYACIVALGCVIRGETPHFEYVASEAASGLQVAAIETGVPVSFGVLTVDTRGAGGGADRPRCGRCTHCAGDGRRVLAVAGAGSGPSRASYALRAN